MSAPNSVWGAVLTSEETKLEVACTGEGEEKVETVPRGGCERGVAEMTLGESE